MTHIVADDYSIINAFYELKGNKYQVIATRSLDYSAKNCIDTIRNLETKKTKEISRIKLFRATRKTAQ